VLKAMALETERTATKRGPCEEGWYPWNWRICICRFISRVTDSDETLGMMLLCSLFGLA